MGQDRIVANHIIVYDVSLQSPPHVLYCTNHDTTVNVSNPKVVFVNKPSLASPVPNKMSKGGEEDTLVHQSNI